MSIMQAVDNNINYENILEKNKQLVNWIPGGS